MSWENDTAVRDLIRNIRNNIQIYSKPLALTETHVSWSSVTGETSFCGNILAGFWIADPAGISLEKIFGLQRFGVSAGDMAPVF